MVAYATSVKQRLDILMVERELAESREKARAMIMAGDVTVDESVIIKPAIRVSGDAEICVRQRIPFVSRGGIKLNHALDHFGIDPSHMTVLDVGASTGGFTDCLLQHGTTKVYALDVGYGQLDYQLRIDPRVVVMERVNARYPFTLPTTVDLITVDISFISLAKVLPNVAKSLKPGGMIICLVKPQFEAAKRDVGKGGLVKEPTIHALVLGRFISWSIESGFRLIGLTTSPILGASGNREFFVLLKVNN